MYSRTAATDSSKGRAVVSNLARGAHHYGLGAGHAYGVEVVVAGPGVGLEANAETMAVLAEPEAPVMTRMWREAWRRSKSFRRLTSAHKLQAEARTPSRTGGGLSASRAGRWPR
jgi:hypothetical protein